MRKKIFHLILILLLFDQTIAQNNLPPVYEIKSDTGVYFTIDANYWQLLEDKEGNLTIKEANQLPVSEKFHQSNQIDYRIHYYWFRYRLKNSMNKDVTICLPNTTNADQSDYYVYNEYDKWTHFTTGILYPYSKKDGLKKINEIPISLKQEEEVLIYNRIKNYYYFNKPKFLSVSIGITNKVIQENYIENDSNFSIRDLSALFTGILLFAVVFSLFFYSIVRDRVYLYYALVWLR